MTLSPKQEETAETIYKLTQKFNYPPTLDEIAASMGITKGTLQYHMTALRKKGVIAWNQGAARSVRVVDDYYFDAFEKKHEPLFQRKRKSDAVSGNGGYRDPGNGEFAVETVGERNRIPILGKIAAGSPLTILDEPDEYLELDSYFPTGCFALKVKGESMVDALISDGDLVLIEPKNTANNGEIVVALLNNDSTTLKRFFKEKDGRIKLQPENPNMEPIFVDPKQDLKIQGIVKGVIRKV